MDNLTTLVLQEFPFASAENGDFIVRDYHDGLGHRIVFWDEEKLGPMPEIIKTWKAVA